MHLNTILARGGGNLNDPGGGEGMLKFRVDRRITHVHHNRDNTAPSVILISQHPPSTMKQESFTHL